MISRILIPVVNSPCLDDLRKGVEQGKELYVSVKTGDWVQRMDIITVACQAKDYSKDKDLWECQEWFLRGKCAIHADRYWVEFSELYLNSHNRQGHFLMSSSILEIDPICGHLVYVFSKTCPACGINRCEEI